VSFIVKQSESQAPTVPERARQGTETVVSHQIRNTG
jgi:hypothetical protein